MGPSENSKLLPSLKLFRVERTQIEATAKYTSSGGRQPSRRLLSLFNRLDNKVQGRLLAQTECIIILATMIHYLAMCR